jgi:hypothetical protein
VRQRGESKPGLLLALLAPGPASAVVVVSIARHMEVHILPVPVIAREEGRLGVPGLGARGTRVEGL